MLGHSELLKLMFVELTRLTVKFPITEFTTGILHTNLDCLKM